MVEGGGKDGGGGRTSISPRCRWAWLAVGWGKGGCASWSCDSWRTRPGGGGRGVHLTPVHVGFASGGVGRQLSRWSASAPLPTSPPPPTPTNPTPRRPWSASAPTSPAAPSSPCGSVVASSGARACPNTASWGTAPTARTTRVGGLLQGRGQWMGGGRGWSCVCGVVWVGGGGVGGHGRGAGRVGCWEPRYSRAHVGPTQLCPLACLLPPSLPTHSPLGASREQCPSGVLSPMLFCPLPHPSQVAFAPTPPPPPLLQPKAA